jgi:hypothetical protein
MTISEGEVQQIVQVVLSLRRQDVRGTEDRQGGVDQSEQLYLILRLVYSGQETEYLEVDGFAVELRLGLGHFIETAFQYAHKDLDPARDILFPVKLVQILIDLLVEVVILLDSDRLRLEVFHEEEEQLFDLLRTLQLLSLEELFIDALDPRPDTLQDLLLLAEFLVGQHANHQLRRLLILTHTGHFVHALVPRTVDGSLHDQLLQPVLVAVNPLHRKVLVRVLDVLKSNLGLVARNTHLEQSRNHILHRGRPRSVSCLWRRVASNLLYDFAGL